MGMGGKEGSSKVKGLRRAWGTGGGGGRRNENRKAGEGKWNFFFYYLALCYWIKLTGVAVNVNWAFKSWNSSEQLAGLNLKSCVSLKTHLMPNLGHAVHAQEGRRDTGSPARSSGNTLFSVLHWRQKPNQFSIAVLKAWAGISTSYLQDSCSTEPTTSPRSLTPLDRRHCQHRETAHRGTAHRSNSSPRPETLCKYSH